MKCNPDNYRKDIASLDLTREQEDELLHILWEMMRMFVEMGYGVQSINRVFPSIFEKTNRTNKDLIE